MTDLCSHRAGLSSVGGKREREDTELTKTFLLIEMSMSLTDMLFGEGKKHGKKTFEKEQT